MDRKVLGRGLEALIVSSEVKPSEKVQQINVSEIQTSRYQPRNKFQEDKIDELAQSIKEKGVIQPVIVRIVGIDQYELIAGERRLRAAKKLGLENIPAIVKNIEDKEALEVSIIENIQREDLNPVEEAKAYQRLNKEFGLTQEMIAQRVGKDNTSVSNILRILNLPENIQDFLYNDIISLGHAKALLSVPDKKRQMSICKQTIEKGLSVRQVEALASLRRAKVKTGDDRDAHIKSVEEKLQHIFGTKVRIEHGRKRGRVMIDYYSNEDLERITKIMGIVPA